MQVIKNLGFILKASVPAMVLVWLGFHFTVTNEEGLNKEVCQLFLSQVKANFSKADRFSGDILGIKKSNSFYYQNFYPYGNKYGYGDDVSCSFWARDEYYDYNLDVVFRKSESRRSQEKMQTKLHRKKFLQNENYVLEVTHMYRPHGFDGDHSDSVWEDIWLLDG